MDRLKRVKQEVVHRHGAELRRLRADGERIRFAHDDPVVEEESEAVGFRLLDYIEGMAVRVFTSVQQRGIIFILLITFAVTELTHYHFAKLEDIPPAQEEYITNFPAWHQRSRAATDQWRGEFLVFPVPESHGPSLPHVPEEDYGGQRIPQGSIVAPISGFSIGISGHYVS